MADKAEKTTELERAEDFYTGAPEPTNFCQFVGEVLEQEEGRGSTVITFKSGTEVVKARIAVARNGARGADYVNLDDFEEDWSGQGRVSALREIRPGALIAVSGEFRKDSSGSGDKRRYFDKVRVKAIKVLRTPEDAADEVRGLLA